MNSPAMGSPDSPVRARGRRAALSPALWRSFVAGGLYLGLALLQAAALGAFTPAWLPAAVTALAAWLWGWTALPGIAMAALVSAMWVPGTTGAAALLAASGAIAGPMLGRWGLRRAGVDPRRLWGDPHGVVAFLLWMGLANAAVVGLFDGAAGLLGASRGSPAGGLWLAAATALAWLCNVTMLAPALHQIMLRWQDGSHAPSARRTLENTLTLSVTAALLGAAFLSPALPVAIRLSLTGMLTLPALWAVLRLGSLSSAVVIAVIYTLGLAGTLAGVGPHAGEPLQRSLPVVELRGLALTSMVLFAAALRCRGLDAMRQLRQLNAELEQRVRSRAEDLARQERGFRALIENLPAPAVVTDAGAHAVLYANPAARDLLRADDDPLLGGVWDARWSDPIQRDALLNDLHALGVVRDRELALRADPPVWVLASAIRSPFDNRDALVFSFKDITESRKREQQLHAQARHDALTGIANRFALEQQLPLAIAHAARTGTAMAVGVIDLDDFKLVNDAWGHAAGDRLLKELAARLKARMRDTDILARLGGDEFVVVLQDLENVQTPQRLQAALQRLHEAIEAPFEIAPGAQAEVGMSMGLALYPQHASEAGALMRQADMAMYQCKRRRHERSRWWQLGTRDLPQPGAVEAFDAYGAEARALLAKSATQIDAAHRLFVQHLVAEISADPHGREVWRNLGPIETERLMQHQLEHVAAMAAPDTGREALRQAAARVGAVHALVGVGAMLQLRAYALYRRILIENLNHALLVAQDRYRILLALETRLQDDMQAQLEAEQGVLAAYAEPAAAALPPLGSLWPDVSSHALNALGTLPGVRAALLVRLNAQGILTPENSAGPDARRLVAVLTRTGCEITVDPSSPRGQGPSARAWRNLQIQSTPSIVGSAEHQAWQRAASSLGLRSSLSVPITDASGQAVAVLSLFGAYAGQFESPPMVQFARNLRRHWEQLWQRCATPAPVMPEERARELRQVLFAGGLRVYMQPVIDLRDGRMVKVEALARIALPDGAIVLPGVFLPLLGEADLNLLFRRSLDTALGHLMHWDTQGLSVDLAVNLPPRTLVHPECIEWVTEALRTHRTPPQRLTLELLETQDIDPALQDQAVERLVRAGVNLSMDDLGSGYSSLQRLSALPFSTVKADQGLLTQIRNNPVQTMSMIRTIVQIGVDLDRAVVVEGLEEQGMIEVARILGAPFGQGFGLARPMPAEAIPDWWRRNRASTDVIVPTPDVPTTLLGALARQWMHLHTNQGNCPGDAESCELGRFIARHHPDDRELAAAHARAHAPQDAPQAGRDFLQLLVQRVRAEARADA